MIKISFRLVFIILFLLHGSGGNSGIHTGTENQPVLSEAPKIVSLSTCCRLNPNVKNEFNHCKSESHYDSKSSSIWTIPQNFMSTKESSDFQIEQRKPFCPSSSIHETFLWNSTTPNGTFYQNGYLKIGTEYYAVDEYCIDGFTDEGVDLNICIPDCGKTRACIPKCCPFDKLYSFGVNGQRGCRAPLSKPLGNETVGLGPILFNPPLYHDFYTQLSKEEISQTLQPHYFLWQLSSFKANCKLSKTSIFPLSSVIARNVRNHFNISDLNSIDFRIRKDGAFMYRNEVEKNCKTEENPKRILCFDRAQDFGNPDELESEDHAMVVWLCSAWDTELNDGVPENQPKELLYGILMLIFSIFPFMTSLVYFLLWSRQNIHGWTIATTAGALFFMYIFQGSALLIGSVYATKVIGTMGCTIVAVVAHFFFLATFSWLTVMCCDLWWTFRSLTPTNRRSKGMKRYIKYSVFGWGLPGAFVIVGVVLDYIYQKSDDCSSQVLPSYGTLSCWIIPSSQGVYVFYPVAVLLSLNTFFFVVTCYKLCRYRQNTKFATKKETSHFQCFSRFTKLFLVMGVSWMFDLLSLYMHGYAFRWYWVVVDVMNILRAVGVFIVYVCKPDIIIALEDQYPYLKRAMQPFKRRCSDDMSMQTGSTAEPPISLQILASRPK